MESAKSDIDIKTLSLKTQILKTQGIKYAGAKTKLLPQILTLVAKTGGKTVLDGFSGTTRVSQALAKNGWTVLANDISAWSQIFGQCYLQHTQPRAYYQELVAHLNAIPPTDGWFTKHYGGAADSDGKKPWQIFNTRKLDGIRNEIDALALAPVDKAVALTSLILALDKVDNTLGHYVSYLRGWSQRSYQPLVLEVPALVAHDGEHQVKRGDVFEVARAADVDVAYFDPPYGSNNDKMPPSRVRYQAYYHLWTSIIDNDAPKIFGRAGRREDTRDEACPCVFEDFRKAETGAFVALEALAKLIETTRANNIILSYSSGGRACSAALHEMLARCGDVREVVAVDYRKNVMSGMAWTGDWLRELDEPHREFLFWVARG